MKKRILILGWALGLSVITGGCREESAEQRIPLIAIDESGNSVQHWVSESEFKMQVIDSSETVRDSVVESMNKRAGAGRWMLRVFTVGMGIQAEMGFGPWKVGASPRFHLGFTNSSNPSLP